MNLWGHGPVSTQTGLKCPERSFCCSCLTSRYSGISGCSCSLPSFYILNQNEDFLRFPVFSLFHNDFQCEPCWMLRSCKALCVYEDEPVWSEQLRLKNSPGQNLKTRAEIQSTFIPWRSEITRFQMQLQNAKIQNRNRKPKHALVPTIQNYILVF